MIRPVFFVMCRFGNDADIDLVNWQPASQETLIIGHGRVEIGLIDAVTTHEAFIASIAFLGSNLNKNAGRRL